MPQESLNEVPKRWYSFHFSGKVIMCSVLFGLGLILIGGLVMAIGIDQKNDPTPDNLNEIQYKAPMVIVGPVLMGIGAIIVITGIIMCLFEMNICRKKKLDNKPLIEEQVNDSTTKRSGPTSISQKREKHRNHKKSRKHKKVSKNNSDGQISSESSSSYSPTSKPINVQNSQAFTISDNFVTPSSSFVPALDKTENQTSKFLLNSDKSWNTSTEFQTPSSSLHSSASFEAKNLEENINSEKINNDKLEVFQQDSLLTKNSACDPGNIEKEVQINIDGSQNVQNNEELSKASTNNLHHEFVTPKNSYNYDSKVTENIAQENVKESNSEQNTQN